MEVLNISRLANQIKELKVIGINDKGHLILQGFGERIDCFGPVICARRIEFYEYNPENDELITDIFNDLVIPNLYIIRNSNELGGEYFFEVENEETVNIIKCDFNCNTYERLFSACSVDEIKDNHTNIQLISLTDNYLAVKIYSKTTYQIFIYDKAKQNKYDILFSENDDMRYAKIKYIDIDNIPYIVFIKIGKSDWKMEFYIHKWEWNEDFKKYKDEKIFLFPLQELINKGNMYLDDEYKIAEADERYELEYHSAKENCIIYTKEDFEKYEINYDNNKKVYIVSTKKDFKEEKFYANKLFFYNTDTRQITKSVPHYGRILVSPRGSIYEQKRENEHLTLTDLIEDKVYKLPYQNAWVESIINEILILKYLYVIAIYDLKKEMEIGRYYTEYKGLDISQPEVREMFIYMNYKYKYFEKEDLLVLY